MRGRCRPVASAKPAMAPVSSRIARVVRREDRAARAERDDDVAGPQAPGPSAAPMLSPVPAATSQPAAVCPAASAGAATRGTASSRAEARAGAGRGGSRRCPRTSSRCRRRRRGRWSTARNRCPCEDPPGQPVVRQHDAGGPSGVLRLVLGQPAQLGHREARRPARGRRRRPRPGPPSSAIRSAAARRGAGVVPQQGVAHDGAVLVEGHHAVLLAPDGDRGHAVEDAVAARLLEGLPPAVGVDLGAVGVRRPAGAHDLAGLGVADDDLVDWVEESTPATSVRRASGMVLTLSAVLSGSYRR